MHRADDGGGPPPLVHLNLSVADIGASIDFYRQWFGFSTEPRNFADGTVFVSNVDGFDLAFHRGERPDRTAAAFHFGFRCTTPDAVRDLQERMRLGGLTITEASDDRDSVSVKCLDPDGYEIEVYWDRMVQRTLAAP